MDQDRATPIRRMHEFWPAAQYVEDASATKPAMDHILQIWRGQGDRNKPLRLDLYGTNFQIQVWQALLRIPTGALTSYQAIANDLGRPNSSRAIGNAVGANPISLLIPCHRVIQQSGILNNYGWGSARKKMILGMECCEGNARQV